MRLIYFLNILTLVHSTLLSSRLTQSSPLVRDSSLGPRRLTYIREGSLHFILIFLLFRPCVLLLYNILICINDLLWKFLSTTNFLHTTSPTYKIILSIAQMLHQWLSVLNYCCVCNSHYTSLYGTSSGHKSTYIHRDVFMIVASHSPPNL